ncbi:MAG: glycerol kinase GlpK [Gammaproteobacteria bacterium]|nr:glycerol kinase GlpK [Gammaproteobacteria bacterium]
MPQFVLALDQGTTSSRSILFDHDGNVVATAQREFTQHFPRSGWVEHDAEEIWATQAATITEALVRAHATPADLAAVGITNQRETTVLWDRASGRAVAPAIVWQDRRTADVCARLKADGHEPEIARRTGLLLDPYFSGTKLAWLLDSDPGLRARAERGELAFGTIDSWLAWKLSHGAEHITDASNASRTLLLNISTGDWDDYALDLLRIPRAVLPKVVPSMLPRGAACAILGGHQVPLGGIAGDQQAALFGQACFSPGMAKNTYGTGCFMLMNTGREPLPSANRLLTTVAWRLEESHYALEGSVFVGGAVVQWLRDGLGLIEKSSDVEALAASVPDTGGVYLVPAFTGLGSPHWDAYARGTMVGLSRGTTRAHIARAALEAIAFQSAEVLIAMQKDAGQPLVELRVDGGATANDLMMQFQADLLGVPVIRPRVTETTALGAAYLAGLSVGFWESTDEVAANWKVDRRFEPAMSREEAEARMRQWSRAVERAREWHVED